jgi:hypothetical protein
MTQLAKSDEVFTCCSAPVQRHPLETTTSKPMSNYLVYQVGCIECGVSSYPIKICETLDGARATAKAHPSTWDTEGGDGYTTIIDLQACKTVA